MNKRYNKSESRKNKPYNKSRKRRPHPPYHESRPRERERERSYKPTTKAIEMERGDALDFDLKVPKVDWQLPTISDIDQGGLADIPETNTDISIPEAPKTQSKPKINDPLELPEFEVKPKQSKSQVKTIPKTKAPQSLGQKPKALSKEQQIQRRRAMQQQNQQRPQMQRNTQVHPAAVIGPVIILFIALSFLSSVDAPAILYLVVLFFIGKHIWSIIQKGGQQ